MLQNLNEWMPFFNPPMKTLPLQWSCLTFTMKACCAAVLMITWSSASSGKNWLRARFTAEETTFLTKEKYSQTAREKVLEVRQGCTRMLVEAVSKAASFEGTFWETETAVTKGYSQPNRLGSISWTAYVASHCWYWRGWRTVTASASGELEQGRSLHKWTTRGHTTILDWCRRIYAVQ